MDSGGRITKPSQLMLGDILHFTNAAMDWNRTRDYRVIIIQQDSIVVSAQSSVREDEEFEYTIPASQLELLGTELMI